MSMRTAGLAILYNGQAVTADLAPHLLGWDYTDNAHGKLDSISLRLEDKAGVWRGAWHPMPHDTLNITLYTENWHGEARQEVSLGLFEIDEPEYAGPPDAIALQGISLPAGSSLRGEDQYRAWEEVRLSQVAGELATAGGLELLYDVPWDPLYDRLEQQDQGDLEFLLGLASREALGLKVDKQRLVIYDRIAFEESAPVIALARGDGQIISYSFRDAARERFAAVHIEYEALTYDFAIPADTGRTLRISGQRVASLAEAERVAKRTLWQNNIKTATCSLTCVGHTSLLAGMNISLSGFDRYDGIWHIDEARHSGPGYTCLLSLHRVLAGY